MDSLAPDRPARTRCPLHPSRVGNSPDGEIPVDCLSHGVLSSLVDGNQDLTLAITGNSTFENKLGSATPIGDGTGFAITIESDGEDGSIVTWRIYYDYVWRPLTVLKKPIFNSAIPGGLDKLVEIHGGTRLEPSDPES